MYDGCLEVVYIGDRTLNYQKIVTLSLFEKFFETTIKIIKDWPINIMKLVKCFIARPWMVSRGEHSGQGRRRKHAYRSI